jgi:2-haloacid dehalogenase
MPRLYRLHSMRRSHRGTCGQREGGAAISEVHHMVMAQAFVFDAYGTLFDVHSVITTLQAFTPQAEAISLLWRTKQLEYSWLRSLMGRYIDFWQVTDEALRFALKRYGLSLAPEQYTTVLNAYLTLAAYAEIPAMLERLAPRPCVILSNGAPHMLAAVVAASGLQGRFTHLLSVDLLKVYKPDPRAYALAPTALGLPKEAMVFVSSNAFDVMGAKAFGFQVVWINRAGAQADELGIAPDLVLSRLDRLPEAFPAGSL